MADRIVVLHEGTVQQVGTPQEVYSQPSNLHVARFMGFRNLLDLEVDQLGGPQVTLRGPGIALTGTVKQELPDKHAVAAIRPDEMTIGHREAPNAIAGRVEGVEYYGRDSLVDVIAESGLKLRVRTSTRVEPGHTVHVAVPPERVLVFPREALAS